MSEKYSSYSMIQRLLALFVLVAFFACLIIFRLLYLQVIGGYKIVEKGLTQWLRDLPLTATRGKITDRNGVVLASSYTTYDVYVRPADVEDAAGVAELLSAKLSLDFAEVYDKIVSHKLSEIKIESDLDKTAVQEILKGYKSGIFFTTNTERSYAYDSLACQILGFVGSDNAGQVGLEAYYNNYLAGINGVSLVESDLKGSTLDGSMTYYEDAINGLNLQLTLDYRLQSATEKIVAEALSSTAASNVSVIITDPSSGEILTLASAPSYNLNEVPRDNIELLNKLTRASAIVDTFEPGSTFKPIVAAIALEEGLVFEHSYFYCGGYRMVNGVRIKCARRSGHGSQSLEQGLMNSCNCVFMDIIEKIGVKKFYSYLEAFGFTQPLGIDFPGETMAVLMPENTVTASDLARMGFGQTIALSSLEMVTGIGAVINGGYVYQPHFIKSITTEVGQVVYSRQKTAKNKVLSSETSEIMRKLMLSVVEKGGGKNAKVEGYPIIGGKTGTAQKYENGAIAQGKYIASFLGFAPYDDPKFLVFVVVDEPQGSYYGGVVAAPIAKQIFEKIFEIQKFDSVEENLPAPDIELPTFIGLTMTQAAKLCASLGLQYLIQGEGDYVTNQVAAPGTMVRKGDIVLLIFD